ncbi:coiled-coil domain-containing protein [Paenibacillus bouchesdurhonensis]|uniref:ATPase n=1 Tax=Paenibacillus bouchesdurhonensis TaxID=1870990 RepID=UPI000DA630F6|nr:ATPase [Paenibacillus bouchesdurhonensis]
MAKQVRFIQLELKNFAGIRKLDEKYGDITNLSGNNGEGKTTFGEAPAWIFFGTDLFGNRFNPSPTTYEFDRVYASLRLSVDGEEMTFTREINENGVNEFCISYVPAKAKEYEAAVAELFSKEEFLSLYNPGFFFTQHWTKQREQVMKHTVPPAKSEVLAEMSRTSKEQKVKDIALNPAAAKLDELTKKRSLDDLQKIHGGTGGQKAKLEKQHIAAQSRTNTLREQYGRLPDAPTDVEAVKAESAALLEQIKKINELIDAAQQTNQERSSVMGKLAVARLGVESAKNHYMKVYNEPIEDACPSCKRPLDEEAVKAVTDTKEARKKELHAEHSKAVAKRKELEAELAGMEEVDVSDLWNEMRELEQKRDVLEDLLHADKARQALKADVEAAKNAEDDTLAALKESIFILDAIKAYRAKEAELQAEKVQSLFTRLKIRLFKYVKTTGEYDPDFSIQMDGKDYSSLSVGEKITAGLELTEVLFKQSELIVPTFVDGIGEYTGDLLVYGQLITARAIKGQELKIETEDVAA